METILPRGRSISVIAEFIFACEGGYNQPEL